MKKVLFTALMLTGGLVFAADTAPRAADDSAEQTATQVNPDGVTVKREAGGEVEEYRVGGRLESMTIDRDRGTTDYWYDRRGDSTWEAGKGEVDEKKNLRQWRLGNW